MAKYDISKWEPLPTGKSAESDGISISVSRLDILFADDPFMAMLDNRLRSRLADVLAQNFAVWTPQYTRKILRQTPYAALWTEEFMKHIESLVWIASAKKKEN